MNIYLQLTRQFNEGGLRAILSSGQAVVLHRLAIMSKDGDWILREEESALAHVLRVLSGCGARYRFGAPLDLRWMAGGWSAHFEFRQGLLRVRTDFVTRPPRLSAAELAALWRNSAGKEPPFLDARTLAEIKKTNREKDYVVIGELVRTMTDERDQLLYSRSARDLLALAQIRPRLVEEVSVARPVLKRIVEGQGALEVALDAERRELMHTNEQRLAQYEQAAQPWATLWKTVERETAGLSLLEAHALICRHAAEVLPFMPNQEDRCD